MKQPIFKQLLLLAVFLFAGIGSAFGQKKITVSRNAQLTAVFLYMTSTEEYGEPTSSDDEKVVFEVEQGSDCQLEVYPTNELAYRVSKVTVGSEDVTADMNTNGYVIIPSVEDDIEVQAVVSEIDETKTISFSIVYDTGVEASCGLIFYDPARDYRVELYQKSVELLVNSTTQMTILISEMGCKVKTLKVDGTDVTETYYSQGYYEFENLQADHSVAVELGEAKTYTITVNRDEIPTDIGVDVNITNLGAAVYGFEHEFNEGTFVTLNVEAIVQDEDGKQFQVRIYDGETDVTPNSIDGGYYAYTINNLSSDHQISLKHEEMPMITVHCTCNDETYDFWDFTLNDEGFGSDQPIAFAKGSNVTFALKDIPYNKVLESIKIDDNDITSSFGGSYVLSNLTADHVITLTLSDAGATYDLRADFAPLSTGTIYLKSNYVEKDETTYMPFAAGTDATLIVKAPIGHKVSNIHIIKYEVYDENYELVSDRTEEDISDIRFNPDTKEYYCEIKMTANTDALITTQEKPDDGTTGIAYSQASGMATFCSEYDLDFSSEATKDIAAYVAIGFNSEASKLMLLRVTEAKRGTPLIIIGKPGSYTIPVKATSRNYHTLLKAVDVETKLTSVEWGEICYTNYVLYGNAFFSTDFTVPAYQAYLQLPDPITGGSGPISIELIDMGDMNGDAKTTITDAVMIVDKILNEQ